MVDEILSSITGDIVLIRQCIANALIAGHLANLFESFLKEVRQTFLVIRKKGGKVFITIQRVGIALILSNHLAKTFRYPHKPPFIKVNHKSCLGVTSNICPDSVEQHLVPFIFFRRNVGNYGGRFENVI